jgi:hypothetical protein
MIRPALLFALTVQAAVTLSVAPAGAQQAGGETLDPEILSNPGAAELIRERAFIRLQTLQSVRSFLAPPVVPGSSPNANSTNPALDRSAINQQALARIPARPERNRGQPGEVFAPTLVDQSQSLTVNAFGSPVTVGDGNAVQQQVANSTAISVGAPASATATTTNEGGRKERNKAGVVQAAQSAAKSSGSSTKPGAGRGKPGNAGTVQSAQSAVTSAGVPPTGPAGERERDRDRATAR